MWGFKANIEINVICSLVELLTGSQTYMSLKGKDDFFRRNTTYYLIWVVFKYILKCENFEETKLYDCYKIFDFFYLDKYLKNYYVFIGGGENIIYLRGKLDIPIILEILYNEYDYIEQLECTVKYDKIILKNEENDLTYKKKQKSTEKRYNKCCETIDLYRKYKKSRRGRHF